MSEDLFSHPPENTETTKGRYEASDIEVLEGLEPVRRRPGMYIGGTDEAALHHLLSEVFDNAMDEAVAGHANRIEVALHPDNQITVTDNGRGIPVDPHPKFPEISALEVILTTLHAGGKFSQQAYATSGGLHGVGISVVNALASALCVEVARDKHLYRQYYSRGQAISPLEYVGNAPNRRGTRIHFTPDADIFGVHRLRPERIYPFIKAKAYLYHGVEIRWSCAPELITQSEIPPQATLHYPGGLRDFLDAELAHRTTVCRLCAGSAPLPEQRGRVEWAIAWPLDEEGWIHSYCNTIATPQGGTHETGLRAAIARGLRVYGDMSGYKKASQLTADDMLGGACIMLSVFLREPQFQGQTKEKLATAEAGRLVESAVRDPFDHWLSGDNANASALIEHAMQRMETRLARKRQKEIHRKSITQKLRLPGKLTDCTRDEAAGTELYLVEGDSAGGSAKMARDRTTQAILPLRGKILNVASASRDKVGANQEINDIIQALGCGSGKHFSLQALRYEKIIIMTDADVDGAHIASLLMTFFYHELPTLVREGHLYLARPPLYRLTHNKQHYYLLNEEEKEKKLQELASRRGPVEVARFKGLGEMTPAQLKETTMAPQTRSLQRVQLPPGEGADIAAHMAALMGRKPELRFRFIQEEARQRGHAAITALDI